MGARPLAPRDQAAPAGEQDAQKLQEPAGTSYTDLACAAADFQARGLMRTVQRQISLGASGTDNHIPVSVCSRPQIPLCLSPVRSCWGSCSGGAETGERGPAQSGQQLYGMVPMCSRWLA